MRYLFETWKNVPVYFNPRTGQFETEKGFSSYTQSHVRSVALSEMTAHPL